MIHRSHSPLDRQARRWLEGERERAHELHHERAALLRGINRTLGDTLSDPDNATSIDRLKTILNTQKSP